MARDKSATVDLRVRMKEPLREKIETAARARGVSLNAEAVDRLARSFDADEAIFDDFGGRSGYEIFRVLGTAASALGSALGKPKWWRYPQIFAQVRTQLCPPLLKVLQKEIAEKKQASGGTTVYWRLTLDLAEPTDEGGKGEYSLAFMRMSRIGL